MLAAARRELAAMSEAERTTVLDAHPRIGADPSTLGALSAREQGGEAAPEVLRELAALNDAYERRFGFRFVVFVDGRSRAAIVPVLRERLANDRAAEIERGIAEYLAIARRRLGG